MNIKNVSASVRDRLAKIAKEEKRNFNSMLLLYFQERLLYRLSLSKYQEKFILKGGLLLYSLTHFKTRPTMDIDFLARQMSNELEQIKEVFQNICETSVDDDGVIYDSASVRVQRIKEDAQYEGVRVTIGARLGQARTNMQLDIGFGDVIVPKPSEMVYPSLLSNMEAPNIKVYTVESVIAEKFEAMISLAEMNTRMKDFYDIYQLMKLRRYDGRQLQEAIQETFQRRNTHLVKDHILFSVGFTKDEKRLQYWRAFLKRIDSIEIEFVDVICGINTFLHPIYNTILQEAEFWGCWNHEFHKWEKIVDFSCSE